MSSFEEIYLEHDDCKFHTFTHPAASDIEYRGVVIIIHGWTEHILMYKDIVKVLSSQGYTCFAYDQREHGTTRGNYINSQCYITDLDYMILQTIDKLGESPSVNLLGHSMGGAIVLEYLQKGKYKNHISSVIACGPYIGLSETCSPSICVKMFMNLIAYFFPNFKYSQAKTLESYALVTKNKKRQLEMLDDELCTPVSSMRLIADMFYRGKWLLNSALTFTTNASVLILQSKDDGIISGSILKKFFDALPISDKEFKFFNNSGHALLLEKDETVSKVYSSINDFLKKPHRVYYIK